MTDSTKLTDRELQEKAANAAGMAIRWSESWGCFERDARPVDPGYSEWVLWRPLVDDGDALRLAVQLHISIYADDHSFVFGVTKAQRQAETDDPETHLGYCECREPDAYAATRRAIVRAAAKMDAA